MKKLKLFENVYFTKFFDDVVGRGYGCVSSIYNETTGNTDTKDNTEYYEQIFRNFGFYKKTK